MRAGGIVVRDGGPGVVDLDIHVRVAWGTVIPDLARQVEEAVRQRATALLSIDLGSRHSVRGRDSRAGGGRSL